MKKISEYESTLRKMIEQRTGNFDVFLEPAVEIAAKCWQMVDHIHDELLTSPLTTVETGSMGQTKMVVNPLLATYDKQQRTMLSHLEGLGLNFRATPRKITEPTKNGGQGEDPMETFLKAAR